MEEIEVVYNDSGDTLPATRIRRIPKTELYIALLLNSGEFEVVTLLPDPHYPNLYGKVTTANKYLTLTDILTAVRLNEFDIDRLGEGYYGYALGEDVKGRYSLSDPLGYYVFTDLSGDIVVTSRP